MKRIAFAVCLLVACRSTSDLRPTPGANGFDGSSSVTWTAESTGGRGPDATWSVRADSDAVSRPNVLALVATNHASEDRFNLYWTKADPRRDVRLSVALRADGGRVDRGGGVAWRVQDANNYYVCRFNPLEANFRVYVVEDGVRRQLGTSLVDGPLDGWHRIDVEHVGDRVTCKLDGRLLLEVTDSTVNAAGGVGLWTKADARTSFDDWSVASR